MPEDTPAAPQSKAAEGLGRRATRGAAWTILGYGVSLVLRMGGNLILTRLLFEEAFGLMALMQVIIEGLYLFSDIGIGPSIIQNKREDSTFLNTAFSMQFMRGISLCALACLLARPMASFYEEPQLAYLLPVVAAAMVISGLNSTRLFSLNRGLTLGRIQIVEVCAQAVGLVTMVTWALVDRSIWALVGGTLATSFARMVMSHTFLPGIRNRFEWERAAAIELIRFGRWIFISTAMSFFAGQTDRLIFGKMIPLDMLGVYSIGLMIATIPSDVLGRVAWRVILPVYSQIVQERRPLSEVFTRVRLPILVLGGWAFSGLLAGGPTAMHLLYDDRYWGAGWIIQVLAPAFCFRLLEATTSVALLAVNRPQWMSAASFAKVLGMIVLIPAGYWIGGRISPELAFPGAVIGYSASETFRYATAAWAATRFGIVGWKQDLLTMGRVFAIGIGGAFVARWMDQHGVHIVLQSAVIAVGVSLLWAPVAWPLIRERRMLRRAEPG